MVRSVGKWRRWKDQLASFKRTRGEAGRNQTRSFTRRAANVLYHVFPPEYYGHLAERRRKPLHKRLSALLASNTHQVPGSQMPGHAGEYKYAGIQIAVPKGKKARGYREPHLFGKRSTIVHEVGHALRIGNDFITANALGNYFYFLSETHKREKAVEVGGLRYFYVREGTADREEMERVDRLKPEQIDAPAALEVLRKLPGEGLPPEEAERLANEVEAYKGVPLKADAAGTHRISFQLYGALVAERMAEIDLASKKPFAGLLALREVIQRPDANFARVEQEIREGKHDEALAGIQAVVQRELRQWRGKPRT